MRAVMFGTIALAVAAGASGVRAAPHGRVVRVERGHNTAHKPVVCVLNGQDRGICLDEPHVGDVLDVIGTETFVGAMTITAASAEDPCVAPWTFSAELLRGDLAHSSGIALINVPLDPTRARVIDVAHAPVDTPGTTVFRALDRNGDGAADFEIVVAPCDDLVGPSTSGVGSCIDTWSDDGQGWTRTSRAGMPTCGH